MNRNRKITQLIAQAIATIREAQHPNGSFPSLSSPRPDDFSGALVRNTTFFASNTLTALIRSGYCPQDIKDKALSFLLGERSRHWSFNYWRRASDDARSHPYPDDIDDTFAALTAIALAAPALLNGEVFAKIVAMLTRLEVGVGGPYRTWLVRQDADPRWRDVDIVANSTVGHFLSLHNIRLPGIEDCIARAIQTGDLSSPYYPGPIAVAYFVAQFYGSSPAIAATARQLLFSLIEPLADRPLGILERAMWICSVQQLGMTGTSQYENSIGVFIDELARSVFPPLAFCIDPATGGTRMYAGASTLTAALCVEALAGHLRTPIKTTALSAGGNETMIHKRVCSRALAEAKHVGAHLFDLVQKQVAAATDTETTSLAYSFCTLLSKKGVSIPKEIVERLSIANLYGWMAYRIYDDHMDGDGVASLVPCANYFLRMLFAIQNSIAEQARGTGWLYRHLMDRIDDANAWELRSCRPSEPLPDFTDLRRLADRSIGHAAGPLAMLLFAGYDRSSEPYISTHDFFMHYLSARQLNDDAHDWAYDLSRGRVNSAAAIILKDAPGAATSSIAALRKKFWRTSIDAIAGRIIRHVTEARSIREHSPLLEGSYFLESGLSALESAARKALAERDAAADFIKYYRPKPGYGAPA